MKGTFIMYMGVNGLRSTRDAALKVMLISTVELTFSRRKRASTPPCDVKASFETARDI